MKIHRNILAIGILLIISGIITALTSHEPSRGLQYIFSLTFLANGILAIQTGRNTAGNFVRSTYYSWVGFISIGLAVAITVLGSDVIGFVNVLGFFLLVLGVVEFVFALQILNSESPIPWELFGLKIAVSAVTSTGAGWILTTAVFNVYVALLFIGILLILAGLSFIQISRWKKDADISVSR